MLVETSLLLLVTFAIFTRHTLLFSFLYDSLINHDYVQVPPDVPSGLRTHGFLFVKHFTHNFGLWCCLFFAVQGLLYVYKPTQSYFHQYKLNKNYPDAQLIGRELLRSIRGLLIATMTELSVLKLYQAEIFPLIQISVMDNVLVNDSTSSIFISVLIATLFSIVIGETHFYFSHRLLHTKYLYQNIHKIHHESINPDPLSGLSMHPIESCIYFSAAYFVSMVCPLWAGRIMIKMLILEPLQGHSGHALVLNNSSGSWIGDVLFSAGIDHYVHHAKFHYNYGANPFWDVVCGTNYPKEKRVKLLNDFYSTGGEGDEGKAEKMD